MRARSFQLVVVALIAPMLAACGAAAPASPSASPQAELPVNAQVRLRLTTIQALPPEATLGWLPQVVVTLDGRVLSGGAVAAIFPGPLVMPVMERQLSPIGWTRLVDAARAAGLLGLNPDFTGGQLPPGSQVTRLELVADGRLYDLRGDATRQIACIQAPCVAPPGTPDAFAGFVNALTDLGSIVGPENLGPEQRLQPAGYAVIVGPAPDDQGLPRPPIAWPLAAGFASFGKPMLDGSGGRCGSITGADLGPIRPAFDAATQITPWRDPADGSLHGLVVRPLLPGDGDPCEGLV
ncbi:MAG TPA: hypothetical protein VFP56_06120 [Candidatus Limnocylindrales bacterium]|nr:hypothetical protein [Candidatus Limnocylindrales bacterium]